MVYSDHIKTTDEIVSDMEDLGYKVIMLDLMNNPNEEIDLEEDNEAELNENLVLEKETLGAKANSDEDCITITNENKLKANPMPTRIIYNDMTTKTVDINVDGRIGEYFQVTLVDGNGMPLANRNIQIGFNGKVYNRTTDALGGAKLQINLARADIYTFAIASLGDDDYAGSFAVAKITTIAQTPQMSVPNKSYKATAKTKTLTASFKTAKGNALAGKTITFTVNGKTYSAKTNAKGVASVKVSLNKKGTYKFTTKFAGDGTYKAISKKATLKLT